MQWENFQPRNTSEAKRLAQWVILVPTCYLWYLLLLHIWTSDPFSSRSGTFGWLTEAVLPIICMVVIGLIRWLPQRPLTYLLVPLPALGTLAVAATNILTHDVGPGSMVTFLLPVLLASYAWRPGAAVTVIVVAVLSVLANVLLVHHNMEIAFLDFCSFAAVMIITGLALIKARNGAEQLHNELAHLARYDPLTGLVTRAVLDERLTKDLADPTVDFSAALVMIDVDRFKVVNDSYGHPVGDAALRHIAQILRRSTRADDLVSRFGGDELVVLFAHCSLTDACTRAEDLLQSVLAEPLELPDGRVLPLSISLGVGHAPTQAADPDQLYLIADQALYQAKRNGRSCVARYHPENAAGPATPPGPTVRAEMSE